MSKTDFYIVGTVKLYLEHQEGVKTSLVKACEIGLKPSKELDKSAYFKGNELTAEGYYALTHALIQGLVACIHGGEHAGFRSSASALRFIIKELELGFSLPTDVTTE